MPFVCKHLQILITIVCNFIFRFILVSSLFDAIIIDSLISFVETDVQHITKRWQFSSKGKQESVNLEMAAAFLLFNSF